MQNQSQLQSDHASMETKEDPVIERFEELIAELQNIFLDIYSNYRRVDD